MPSPSARVLLPRAVPTLCACRSAPSAQCPRDPPTPRACLEAGLTGERLAEVGGAGGACLWWLRAFDGPLYRLAFSLRLARPPSRRRSRAERYLPSEAAPVSQVVGAVRGWARRRVSILIEDASAVPLVAPLLVPYRALGAPGGATPLETCPRGPLYGAPWAESARPCCPLNAGGRREEQISWPRHATDNARSVRRTTRPSGSDNGCRNGARRGPERDPQHLRRTPMAPGYEQLKRLGDAALGRLVNRGNVQSWTEVRDLRPTWLKPCSVSFVRSRRRPLPCAGRLGCHGRFVQQRWLTGLLRAV